MENLTILFLLFLAGLGFLVLGAGWLVKGATDLAYLLGMRLLVIGLIFVAFGTSCPEVGVSILAAIHGKSGIALGNAIGSNIVNIGLVLGLCALVMPIKINRELLRREIPIVLLSALGLYVLCFVGRVISRIDAAVLLLGFIIYLVYIFYKANRQKQLDEELKDSAMSLVDKKMNKPKASSIFLLGLVILMAGAQLMVSTGSRIALRLGISEVVLGITIFALGTSLPELAVSLAGVFKKREDIAVGNVLGSNIFNILLVVGLAAMINPIRIESQTIFFEMPVLIIFTLATFLFMKTRGLVERWEGAVLLLSYIGFIVFLFLV